MARSPSQRTEPSPVGDNWVVVNGERHPLPAGGGLLALLQDLEITPETKGVAVAVDDALIPRADWAASHLHPGDRVEVVRAVQGG